MSPAVRRRFYEATRAVGLRGAGISLDELATAHALARELESPEPDRTKIERWRLALGINEKP